MKGKFIKLNRRSDEESDSLLRQVDTDEQDEDKSGKTKSSKSRRISAIALIILVVLIMLPWSRILGLDSSGGGNSQIVCYIVDINDTKPGIVIAVDTWAKVKRVFSQNEEGDIVLSDKFFNHCADMHASNCINEIIKQCAQLGYLDCRSKDNKVTLTLVGEDKYNFIKIDSVAKDAQEYLKKLYVYAKVDTAKADVKSFVQSKGWKYKSNNMDNYMEQINKQSKYTIGTDFDGDILIQAENSIQDYYKSVLDKNTILKRMSEKLNEIEKSDDIDVDYWQYKKVQNTSLAPNISKNTLDLIFDCDTYVSTFRAMGGDISSSEKYAKYVEKYAVIQDVEEFLDSNDYIYKSEFFDAFLSLVDDQYMQKFKDLQSQVNDYYNQVIAKLNEGYNERMYKYSSIFERRPVITYKDYDEYLKSRA